MRSALFAVVLVLVAACGKNNEPPPPSTGRPGAQTESGPRAPHDPGAPAMSAPPAADPAAQAHGEPTAQARAMYGTACVMCHGPNGGGDGPAAATLQPRPRSFADAAWQASVTDEQIKQILLRGGAGVGKSAMMPAHPELEGQPALLDGLVAIVRAYGKK